MKVLLLNPPYIPNFIRTARSTLLSISGSSWYPIFLGYTTGWLLKHKHKVKLVDAQAAGMTREEVYSLARDFKPEMLILYVSSDSLKNDIAIGGMIKKKTGCEIYLVGPWCSYKPEKMLRENRGIDGVVRREFDGVALDLANGKKKKEIKGLIYRDGEKIISNPEREFLTEGELDQFPFVTKIYKEFLPINKYYQASLLHPYVDLFSGRGCIWGKCTFCLWPNTIHKGAKPYRMRKVEGVIEELSYIKKELPNVREVFFQDDTLPSFRAREISERILRKGINMRWSCYGRANLDLETMKLMKRAGCRYLHVGYESADGGILKNIKKGVSLSQMEEFTKEAKRAGIKVHGDFILGLPGETEKTILKTRDFAKKLGIPAVQVFVPQVYPGTPLFEGKYKGLSQKKLSYWRFRVMREIYLSPSYLLRRVLDVGSYREWLRLIRTALYVIPNILKITNDQHPTSNK